MNVEELNKKFSHFASALKDLKKRNEGLESVNQNLREENSRLKSENQARAEVQKETPPSNQINPVIEGISSSGGDKEEIKKLLDRYISELDVCIEKVREL